MDILHSYDIQITGSTGTITPAYDQSLNLIKLTTTGTVTLTANFSLNLVNYEIAPIYIPILFDGTVILDGFTFNLAGISIKQSKLKGKTLFMLFYDGTAWTLLAESDDNSLPDVIAGEKVITAPTSGTVTLVPGIDENYVRVTGTQTLSGNYTIAFANGVANDWFYIDVRALITTGANVLNIGTIVIDAATALAGNYTIIAYCAGGADWRSIVIGGNFDLNKIASGSLPLNKIAAVTALSVLVNATNAAASPTPIAIGTNQILTSDGTNLVAQAITALMLRINKISAPVTQTQTISAAAVGTMGATPVILQAAGGVGTYLSLNNAQVKVTYVSAAYTGDTTLAIRYTGATLPIAQCALALLATGTSTFTFEMLEGDVIENAALELYVVTGNPSTGDSGITIYPDIDIKSA
jgi:hypothetical protein